MSSRALRRLHGGSSILELAGHNNEVDTDTDVAQDNVIDDSTLSKQNKIKNKKQKKATVNPFELLNAESDEEEECATKDQEEEDDKGQKEALATKEKVGVKAKKKKKKRKGREKENDAVSKTEDDEIEASIQEVNRILGDPGQACAPENVGNVSFSINMKPLLHIDYRNLNAETELKRMFGSQVVQGDQQGRNRRQRNRPMQRSSRLVQAKDTWHSTGGSGLSMKYLVEQEGFTFEHSSAYQKLQHRFCDAVESGQPELIMSVLRENPYHIDALIQMADFHRINEDFQTAAESIEKALYGLECAFHPMFNLAAGNCYLSYRRPENSLNPADDPLDCLSMIDFYALRCGQYEHLVQLYQEVVRQDSERRVPNFALSVPLAHFKIASGDGSSSEVADKMLQDSLLFFPMLLMPLLDQCSVKPDKRVSCHSFFSTSELNDSTSELKRLITMYVKRCEPCWKEPEVMAWLERNVAAVMDIVDSEKDPRPAKYAKMRCQRFKHPPLGLLRHYVLSEIQGLGLPRQYITATVLNHDPFPPHDSIISYTRPQRVTVASEDQGGMLRSLLHSLFPSYNPYEAADVANRRQRAAAFAGGDGGEEAEVAGVRGIPHQIQHSVNAIMHAMRQLLNDPRILPNMGGGAEELAQDPAEDNEREWEEENEEFQDNR